MMGIGTHEHVEELAERPEGRLHEPLDRRLDGLVHREVDVEVIADEPASGRSVDEAAVGWQPKQGRQGLGIATARSIEVSNVFDEIVDQMSHVDGLRAAHWIGHKEKFVPHDPACLVGPLANCPHLVPPPA